MTKNFIIPLPRILELRGRFVLRCSDEKFYVVSHFEFCHVILRVVRNLVTQKREVCTVGFAEDLEVRMPQTRTIRFIHQVLKHSTHWVQLRVSKDYSYTRWF
jgi:hypothetical protein